MTISTITENQIAIITLEGNLLGEVDGRPILDEYAKIAESGSKKIILNLEGLKFINSTGLGALLTLMTKARNAGGEIIFVNLSDSFTKLITITKLTSIFNTANSVSEATQKFS